MSFKQIVLGRRAAIVMKIKCKVGTILNQKCHRRLFSRKRGLVKFSLLTDEEKELISMRSGISFENSDLVCLHHNKFYKSVYEHQQRFCADPRKTHKKKISNRNCLRSINLRYAKIFGLIPGQKLCTNCFINLLKEHGLNAGPTATLNDSNELQQQPTSELIEDKLNVTTTITTTLNDSNELQQQPTPKPVEDKLNVTTTITTTLNDSNELQQQPTPKPVEDKLNVTTTITTTLNDSNELQQQPTPKPVEDKLNVTTTITMAAETASNSFPIENVSPQNVEKTNIEKKVPSKDYNGSCHCGAVQFKCVAPEKLLVYECNCSICYMKQNSHFIVNKANFTLLTGKDNLTTYQFNTMKAEHIFCRTCGVQSFYVPRSNPDSYGINPRCLKSFDTSQVTVETFDGQNWEEVFAKKPPISTHF